MRTKREDPTRIAVVSAGSRNLRSYDSSPLNLEIEFVSDDGDADSVQTGNASNPKKKRSAQKENAQNQNSPTHSQASKRARQASANSPPPSKYRAASTEPPASPRSSARTAKKTGPSSLAKEVRTKRPTAGSKRPYTPPPNTKISSRKSLSENPEDDAEGNTTLSPSKTPSKRSPASKSNVSTTKPKPSKRTSASAVNSRKRTKKSTSDVENTSLADSESTSKSLAQLKSSSSSKSIGRQAATEKPRRGGRSNPNSKNRGRRPPKKRNSESESESAPALEVCATIPIDRLASDSAASASASLQLVHMHPLYKKYPQLLLESHVDLCDRDDCSFVADLKRRTRSLVQFRFYFCSFIQLHVREFLV